MRAFRAFLELRRYGPAGAGRLDSEGVRTRFAAGQAAMDMDWADTGLLAGASLSGPQVARDLRLPGYRAYITAQEGQLDRGVAGRATPEEGQGAAARSWEALTDRLGRNSQRRHYREAMGLE